MHENRLGIVGPGLPLLLAVLLGSLGCAKIKTMAGPTGAAGTGEPMGTPGTNGTAGSTGTMGTGGTSGAVCTPSVTCTPAGGQYCGKIGNGCRAGILDCGMCPGDGVCSFGACLGGPSCLPLTCSSGGSAKYCGTVGDGCGAKLDCGACPGGQTCSGGICMAAGCEPSTCNTAGGGRYCGKIGDGCGATLDCGGCAAPLTCGGGGIDGVCGGSAAACTPVSCTPAGGQYCGLIGNGCGGSVDCGACADGMACSTGTSAHVCPSMGTGACAGLQCQLDKCAGGAETSISGYVYDPAGKNRLYNILLYVPNAALDPVPTGASCDKCDSPISGQPVAAGLSDATGHFVIHNAPHGTNIPLVIQIGKWRRQITVGQVTACKDNPFDDPTTFRLPRSQAEGHLPRIALSTGHSDSYDCLLRKIGIADSEFTNDVGAGRVHMYVGGAGNAADQGAKMLASGAAFADSYATLFPSAAKMMGYDMLILQCEREQLENAKTPYVGNMKRYADGGGRIFADHLHAAWIRLGLPPWPATANWVGVAHDLPSPVTAMIDTTFPKGAALADWLVATGATPTRGQISLIMGQHSVAETYPPATQRWIWVPHNTEDAPMMRQSTQYLTFNTPVETTAANQCGRVVFTDVHVSNAGDSSHPEVPFPMGCTAPLDMTPQEKALEFMFFDLSSCVQIVTGMPMVPSIPLPGVAPTPPPAASPAPPAPPPAPPPPAPPMIN